MMMFIGGDSSTATTSNNIRDGMLMNINIVMVFGEVASMLFSIL